MVDTPKPPSDTLITEARKTVDAAHRFIDNAKQFRRDWRVVAEKTDPAALQRAADYVSGEAGPLRNSLETLNQRFSAVFRDEEKKKIYAACPDGYPYDAQTILPLVETQQTAERHNYTCYSTFGPGDVRDCTKPTPLSEGHKAMSEALEKVVLVANDAQHISCLADALEKRTSSTPAAVQPKSRGKNNRNSPS